MNEYERRLVEQVVQKLRRNTHVSAEMREALAKAAGMQQNQHQADQAHLYERHGR